MITTTTASFTKCEFVCIHLESKIIDKLVTIELQFDLPHAHYCQVGILFSLTF